MDPEVAVTIQVTHTFHKCFPAKSGGYKWMVLPELVLVSKGRSLLSFRVNQSLQMSL
ncbi:hypothetical protein YC2023_046722 [Brassica napus]